MTEHARRTAPYVRMSTDLQKYSTENQAAAIAEYACRHCITIVRTYADEGRCGLGLDQRQTLKDLISDVLQGRADFDRILVYDVSRWGRFQDADDCKVSVIASPARVITQLNTEDSNSRGGSGILGVAGALGAHGSMCGQRLGMKPQG